ncbi:hypothetical protein F3K40_42845 [Streptomyces sp. LBUM 1478]|nr:hypothetical protein [Streptomyces sp. LBUM 1478]
MFPRGSVTSCGTWIGPALARTGLHHDLLDNLAVQITGRKRFYLARPGTVERAGALSVKYDAWARLSRVASPSWPPATRRPATTSSPWISNLIAISEWVADAPQHVLGTLGFGGDPFTGCGPCRTPPRCGVCCNASTATRWTRR